MDKTGRNNTIQPQDLLDLGDTTDKKPEEGNHEEHSSAEVQWDS